jgi:glycosidase
MSVPEWVKSAVFYQIFPDRFANGDPGNDPVNVRPWGSPPTVHGFQGGDLRGITRQMDYFLDLGINAIYLNPIFQAASTHRYDTSDYLRIDPKLGDLNDFKELIAEAHRSGVRVILDGVFNHCARGFFAFNDILENGADSPYLDWFHIKRFPLRAYDPGHARNYDAWWGIKSLPKLNTSNPQVRRYLLDVSRYWIELGADGWRLDVPNEINDDGFWAEFRAVVRQANPDAYTLGEIWDVNPRWANDSHFDGLMNYPLRTAVFKLLAGECSAAQFGARVEELLTVYPRENIYAQYNLLGSHDTARILTLMEGDTRKVGLAMLFLFAYPGTPSVYYGDEVGLPGGTDPDCRRAFPWDRAEWDEGLRGWVKTLIAARRAHPALQDGDFKRVAASQSAYVFARSLGDQRILVALNASGEPADLRIPTPGLAEGTLLRSLLTGQAVSVQNGAVTLRLDGYGGDYLM